MGSYMPGVWDEFAEYRLKPKPQSRPSMPQEVAMGSVVKKEAGPMHVPKASGNSLPSAQQHITSALGRSAIA